MTRRTLRTLIVVVVALAAILFLLETDDRQDDIAAGGLLFPDLKSVLNDVTAITVTTADADTPTQITGSDGQWRVAARDGYPASVGKIREVLLAIADARIVEEKTSDPERYGQLGVQGPGDEGAESVMVSIAAPEKTYELIVGKPAQRDYRYVRIADAAQSVLIDRNPDIPDSPGDWVRPEVVDIDASRVRSVRIQHADGETIAIGKASMDLTDYTVEDIPEGRELSYATVANGMAGALKGLTLDDVRKKIDGDPATTTTVETFDGLTLTISLVEEDEATWAEFSAVAAPVEPEPADTAEGSEDISRPDSAAIEQEAADINARLDGWQYQLPQYKKNLLIRRWDDILKSE